MGNDVNDDSDPDFIKDLMNRLNITALSRINPGWIAVPTYLSRRKSLFHENEIVEECGKGTTDMKARKSALFEAAERCSAEIARGEKEVIKGTYSSLKDRYTLMPPSIVSNKSLKNAVEILELEWYPGHDLLHDENVFIPVDYVFFPCESAFYVSNTVGLASGETYDNAVLHALYEVIEHDALNIYTYNSIPGKDITIDTDDDIVYDIYSSLISEGITPTIKFLSNDIHVPVILVLFEHVQRMPGVMTAGMGAHLDSSVAAIRALTECAQATSFWYYKMQHTQKEELPKYEFPPLYVNFAYRETKSSTIALNDITSAKGLNTSQSIEEVVKRLGKFASRAISVDITTQRLGVPAVRVIVPECENTFTDHVARCRTKMVQRALQSYFRSPSI